MFSFIDNERNAWLKAVALLFNSPVMKSLMIVPVVTTVPQAKKSYLLKLVQTIVIKLSMPLNLVILLR